MYGLMAAIGDNAQEKPMLRTKAKDRGSRALSIIRTTFLRTGITTIKGG